MRKHFLILMLMALLPLAGWAEDPEHYDVTVTLGTINIEYGTDVPAAIDANKISITKSGGDLTKADLATCLTYRKLGDTPYAVGESIYYTVTVDKAALDAITTHYGTPAIYNVVIANNGFVNVLPKALTDVTITYTIDNAANIKYKGAAWTNEVQFTVKDGDDVLEAGTDYELATNPYGENTTVATGGTIKIKGKGNYDPYVTKTLDFAIKPGDFASVGFAAQPNFIYNHAVQEPTFTVKVGNNVVVDPTEYSVTYYTDEDRTVAAASVEDAGIYYVKITGTSTNFTDGVNPATNEDLEFTIAPRSIVDGEGNLAADFELKNVANLDGLIFTGLAQIPEVTLKYKGYNLSKTDDYTRTYANNINATTESSKATITYTGKANSNYTGSFVKEFEIAKADIAGVTIDPIADQSYNGGLEVEPALTVKLGDAVIAAADYVAAYTNNTAQGEATVTITPAANGNFTGTNKVANFNIGKATLKVTPVAASKNLGTSDPELTYTTVEGYGLLGNDAPAGAQTIAEKINSLITTGAITVTRADGESAGQYNMTAASTAVAENYTIVAVNDPVVKFTINQAGVTITATPVAQEYGYKLPTLDKDAFVFTAVGLTNAETITALTFTVTDAEENEYAAGEMLPVGEYTVTPSAATATSDSYTFSYVPGTLVVSEKAIKFIAQPQTIDYPVDEAAVETLLAKDADDLGEGNTSWSDALVKVVDAEGNDIDKATFKTLYGVWKEDFIESLTYDGVKKPANPGVITVNLKNAYSANFAVTTETGAVTFAGVPAELVLNRAETGENSVKSILETYNGAKNTIKIKDSRVLNANQWYSFVLPFATTAREISQAFGYAVVDVPDASNTAANVVKFKLTVGEVRANEYFLVKIDQQRNLNDKPIVFNIADVTDRTIDYDPSFNVTDAGGNVYQGVYEKTPVNDPSQWYMSAGEFWNAGTNPSQIAALGGYVYATAGARATIIVEEADGSTTAINAVTGEQKNYSNDGWYTVNGVKLQGMPTEKGVYINNGKKVVLK